VVIWFDSIGFQHSFFGSGFGLVGAIFKPVEVLVCFSIDRLDLTNKLTHLYD
jgi:hypothetical protein